MSGEAQDFMGFKITVADSNHSLRDLLMAGMEEVEGRVPSDTEIVQHLTRVVHGPGWVEHRWKGYALVIEAKFNSVAR